MVFVTMKHWKKYSSVDEWANCVDIFSGIPDSGYKWKSQISSNDVTVSQKWLSNKKSKLHNDIMYQNLKDVKYHRLCLRNFHNRCYL